MTTNRGDASDPPTALPAATALALPRTAILSLLALLVVAHVALTFRYHVPLDIAHVTFRYADNLGHHRGLAFNPGERVEAYTSFLWTLLLAPFLGLGADAMLVATLLGTLASAVTVLLTYALARALGTATAVSLGAAAVAAGSPYLAYAAGTGLETAPFTTTCAAGLLAAIRSLGPGAARSTAAIAGAVLGVATLVRLEATLPALVVAAWLAATSGRRASLAFAAGCSAPLLPYLVFRAIYFGGALPQAAYFPLAGTADQLARGLRYVHDGLAWSGAAALLFAVVAVGARDSREEECGGAARLLAASTVAYLAWVVASGAETMPMFRLLLPALPPLWALAARGLDRALPVGPQRLIAGVTLVALLTWPAIDPAPATTWLATAGKLAESRDLVRIGRALHAQLPPGSSLATGVTGTVAYHSGLTVIDTFGVTDPHIRTLAPDTSADAYFESERGDGRYLLERAVDYILPCQLLAVTERKLEGASAASLGSRFQFKTEREVWALPEFQGRYRVRSVPVEGGGYVNLFERYR